MKRAEQYAAMLPKGAEYEIGEKDGIVSLVVRNSIEYLFVIISDSRGSRTRARAYGALNGRRTKPIPLWYLPHRLRGFFI